MMLLPIGSFSLSIEHTRNKLSYHCSNNLHFRVPTLYLTWKKHKSPLGFVYRIEGLAKLSPCILLLISAIRSEGLRHLFILVFQSFSTVSFKGTLMVKGVLFKRICFP
jgi:hypothetical protein